jgi:predicted methyltransferase
MKKFLIAAALLATQPLLAAAPVSGPISAAVAAPGRPAAEVALDAGRKPGEMLSLAGLAPGQRVVDVMAGQGYYSRIAASVVGPKGSVVALMPPSYMKRAEVADGWAALKAANPQMSVVVGMPAAAALPGDIDLTIFHLTYHDLYWESAQYEYTRQDPAAFLAKLFAATRPGGKVLVVDHVGAAGVDPRVEADKTHRIDPAVVEKDFAAAGFKLAATSDLLRNPADKIGTLVFDPAVRGKTDRRVWVYQKPVA